MDIEDDSGLEAAISLNAERRRQSSHGMARESHLAGI